MIDSLRYAADTATPDARLPSLLTTATEAKPLTISAKFRLLPWSMLLTAVTHRALGVGDDD